MNNKNFKKLLKEYKEKIMAEGYNETSLLKDLAEDAVATISLWLEIDMTEYMNGDNKTQIEFINGSLDNFIEDIYDDIEESLPEGTNIDKWFKKTRKKLIFFIRKELNK